MAVVTYKFNGLKETSKALNSLTEPKFRKAALRRAGKQAMSPTLTSIIAAAPSLSNTSVLPEGAAAGDLKGDIKMSVSVNVKPKVGKSGKITKASQNELKVTIKTGKKTEQYALVSEYGRKETTVMKYHAFGKPVLGFEQTLPQLTPEPWMRPTFDRQKADIVSRFNESLGNEIILQAKKQKKYLGK